MDSAALKRWLDRVESDLFAGLLEDALRAPDIAADHPAPLVARSWILRASALRRQQQLEAAGRAYRQARALAPDEPWILARLITKFYLDRGRTIEARATAARAVALARSSVDLAEARAARAQVRFFDGEVAAAIDDWAAAAAGARPNSILMLCSIFNIAAAMAQRSKTEPNTEAAEVALVLASTVRQSLKNRDLPRVRGFLRWTSGLAEAARGRRFQGSRDLIRSLQGLGNVGDVGAAALVAVDYGAITRRNPSPLVSELLDGAPADTESQILVHLRLLVDGRDFDRKKLAALALAATIRRRNYL